MRQKFLTPTKLFIGFLIVYVSVVSIVLTYNTAYWETIDIFYLLFFLGFPLVMIGSGLNLIYFHDDSETQGYILVVAGLFFCIGTITSALSHPPNIYWIG